MKSICALVLFLLSCVAAHATQIPVRSGEHEDFTRLVLTIPAGSKFEVTSSDKSARISLAQPDANFDVSAVFSRIPRTRLLKASQAKTGADLILELGCDCQVQSFRFSPTQVVVDIRDEPPKADTKAQPLEIIPPKSRSSAELQSDIAANATIGTAETRDTLIGLRKTLTNDLKRAQFKGLIANPKTTITPVLNKERPGPENGAHTQQIQTITAFEIGSKNHLRSQDNLSLNDNCPASRAVDVTTWGITENYEYEFSTTRKQLTDESGKIDRKSLERLIKVQVYFGFGSEAEKLLQLTEPTFSDQDTLLAIARSMDGFRGKANDSLDGHQSCKNSAAMWSLLVEGAASPDLNTRSLQRAFSKLPTHLKVLLAPKVGEILHKSGLVAEASAILNRVERKTIPSEPLEFVKASIDAEKEEDISPLEKISESNSEKAPDALSLIFTHGPPTPDHNKLRSADLVDSYRTELKNSQNEADLTKATILAYADAKDFESSESMLQDARSILSPPEWQTTWDNFAILATKSSEDLFFVDFVMRNADRLAITQNGEILQLVGDRMTDLGLREEVKEFRLARRTGTAPETSYSQYSKLESAPVQPDKAQLLPKQENSQSGFTVAIQSGTQASPLNQKTTLLNSQNLIESSETLREEVATILEN